MRLVVIDPGHGGTEQRGSSSPFGVRGPGGSREKELTLALARRLRARLEPHIRVHLTRDRDENRSLAERADTARRLGAEAFLSLHGNGGPRGQRGSETWIHPGAAPSARRLADGVARALAPVLGPGRGVRSAPMAVLDPDRLGPVADACLVEVDYLTDGDGERHLNDAGTLDDIAEALAGALRAHLETGRAPRDDAYGRRGGGVLVGGRAGARRFGLATPDEQYQMHESAAVLRHLGDSLLAAGPEVSTDDLKRDLDSIGNDGRYPYIDGGMGAISEPAAHVLVHAIHQHGGFADLVAAMVAKHGGDDALGAEMVKALDGGGSIEGQLLREIADQAVAGVPSAGRAKVRARFDGLLAKYGASRLAYYFLPRATSSSAPTDVTPTGAYLPTQIRDFWARDAHRQHHALWHTFRSSWGSLNGAQQTAAENAGWKPARFDNDPGSGLDFFAMHRRMVADANAYLALVGDPLYTRIAGWSAIPFDHADVDWPMPAVPSTSWLATSDAKTQSTTDDKQKLVTGVLENDAEIAKMSLDRYGLEIEWQIHGWMHYHWSAGEPADAGKSLTYPDGRVNDWLGHPFSSAVNPAFWKLHGWIDDRIAQWERVHGASADAELAGGWNGPMPAAPSALAISQMGSMEMAPIEPAFYALFREAISAFRFRDVSRAEFLDLFPDTSGELIGARRRGGRRGLRYGAAASYWPEKYPVIGLDLSNAQGKVDWNAVHGWRNLDGNPIRFCFIKASEHKVDDSFNRNWALACGSQRHETEGVAAHIVTTLADAGTTVSKDDVKSDLASVGNDGSYPYIDGGMGAISEAAAQILVHAIRDGRVLGDLIAAVVTKHGGASALGDEMVDAADKGTTLEPRILKELTDEAVAASPAAGRAKRRARYDKLLKDYQTSNISYYFSPSGPDAGIVRGPYHFFHPSRSATGQAQQLFDAVEAAGGFRDEDLPPVIDFESDDGSTTGKTGGALMAARTALADALADCLGEVERLFGRTPIIYASPGMWDSFINPADNGRFAGYPLWAARYDRGDNDPTSLDPARTPSHALGFNNVWTDPPTVPSYAPAWSFWQIRIVPKNEIDGVTTTLDCDVFNGTLADLNALAAARPAAAAAAATGGGMAAYGGARRPAAPGAGLRFGSGAHERYPRRG
jgi:N-acetylmuramoyl-L-alanine amidase/GH25 family lysozyme M1 (1,4-beta-N-acetylmuramidase)